MSKLWILPIIALVCAVAFIATLCRHNVPAHDSVNPINKPARIVSLAPNLTEILFALGLDEKIVAVSSNCDYPPAAADKNKVGTFWQPSTEAIIASRPDLVITLSFEQQNSVADSLKRLGFKVLTLRLDKIQELFTAIQKIGTATGNKQQADELVENIGTQLDNLKSKLSSTNKVKVLWVVQLEPLRLAGRNTFVNEIIELAGGENAIGPTISQYPQIGSEELLLCGAEVIIQSAMGTSDIADQQQAAKVLWSRWANLPAVKNNRIYVVEPDTILRLGPRLYQGVELIAHRLHPETFTQKNNVTQ